MVSILSEIGEAETSGGSLSTISWRTIAAWSEITGMRLNVGEALAIRRLSSAYVFQFYESESPTCQAPNIERLPEREEVALKMKTLFSMLRGNKS